MSAGETGQEATALRLKTLADYNPALIECTPKAERAIARWRTSRLDNPSYGDF